MPTISKRIVIGLADSSRLAGFFGQEGGGTFDHHIAFDGRTSSGSEHFDRDAFRERTGRNPSGGEVGCAISHFEVLRYFAQQDGSEDDLVLVAEDDARLSPHTESVLSSLEQRGESFDILLLANPFDKLHGWSPRFIGYQLFQQSFKAKRIRVSLVRSFFYGRIYGVPYGTGLYLCSRRAARKYMTFVGDGRISWVADDYLHWAKASAVDIQTLRPNLAGWYGESTIRDTNAWQSRSLERMTSLGDLIDAVRIFAAPRIRMKALRMRFIATRHDAQKGRSLLSPPD